MPYAHYWRRPPALKPAAFHRVMEDVKLIVEELQSRGVRLAGPTGTGDPVITREVIAFNGSAECGHRYRNLGKAWPSATAKGIEETNKPVAGGFLMGAKLETRVCGGNCSQERFVLDREYMPAEWETQVDGKFEQSCETYFKPYDLAVTAVLIRLREHFPDDVTIYTDGPDEAFKQNAFADALKLVRELFGWPKWFVLEKEPESVVVI